MWDEYVLDSIRSAQYCAAAFNKLAETQTDAALKANLQGQASAFNGEADLILKMWNIYAGKSDDFVVLQGADILQTFQKTVIAAGNLRTSLTTGTLTCSLEYLNSAGDLTLAVSGPDPSLQASVIARIEGLGILASGVLQILVGTASASLQAAGSAAQWTAGQVKTIVETTTSSLPWIVGGLVVGSVAVAAIIYAPEIKSALAAKKSARV